MTASCVTSGIMCCTKGQVGRFEGVGGLSMTIEKVIRLMDWLIQGLMIGIIFCWTVWPEDIVGTQELAVLLM